MFCMKKLSFTLLMTLSFFSATAQIVEPIHWKIDLNKLNDKELKLVFIATIDDGWHLYDTDLPEGGPIPTSFTYEKKQGLSPVGKTASTTKPISKKDEIFNLVLSWYNKDATFVQRFTVSDPKSFLLKGSVRFMACNDESCLAPTSIDFEFNASDLAKLTGDATATTAKKLSQTAVVPVLGGIATTATEDANSVSVDSTGKTTEITEKKSDNSLWKPVISELKSFRQADGATGSHTSWWILFFSGFLGGLLALLTPCVWPIIPMTVSFFLKRNNEKKKAVREAILYGFSIVVIYLALGIGITLLFGASALNSLSTNAFFNLLFFALLVFFAISFFGAFEIVLPASWTNMIDKKADSTSGLLSIFFMAFTLVLVSFSCTGPIIGTLLVEAATTGAVTGPAIGMFGFSLALAIPFALFAVFPSMLQRLPKSGSWLQTFKVVLGFLELAFALKFLSVADMAYGWGILPRPVFLALWILLFGIMGLWLIFKAKKISVIRVISGIVSLTFAAWMVTGFLGAPLKSISAFAPPATAKESKLYNQQVHAKYMDYEAGMAYAATVGKPVLLDFSGFGCVNCRKMENSVWQDPEIKQILQEDYVLITLMVDDKTPLDSAYAVNENGRRTTLRTVGDRWSYLQRYKFGANAQPFYVLLTPEGLPIGPSYAYNEDVQAYSSFLRTGLKSFSARALRQLD
jgi:thiol:disulfide interchange protein